MSPDIVTQLVSEKPIVVVVGATSSLRTTLINMLKKYDFDVVVEAQEQQLQSAYKIIWLLTDGDTAAPNYQLQRSTLHKFQDKTTILLPIITGIKAPIDDFYHDWEENVGRQKALIVDCNYYFPRAAFMFGQDVWSATSVFQPLHFLSLGIKRSGKLYDPHISLFPQSELDYVQGVENYLFRPQSNVSVVIRGKEIASSQLCTLVAHKYAAYHQLELPIVDNAVQNQQNIPFSAVIEESSPDIQRLLHAYIQTVAKYQPPTPPRIDTTPMLRPQTLPATQSVNQQLIIPPVPPPPMVVPTPPKLTVTPPPPLSPAMPATSRVKPTTITTPASRVPSVFPHEPAKSFSKPLAPAPKEPEDLQLNQELERIFQTPRKTRAVARIENAVQKHHTIQRKTKRKKSLFYVGLGFVGSGLGVLFLIGFFWISQFWVRSAIFAVLQDYASSAKSSDFDPQSASVINLRRATWVLKLQTQSYGALADIQAVSRAAVLVDIGEQTLETISSTQEIKSLTTQLVLTLFGAGNQEPASLISSLGSRAQKTYETISLLQAGIDQDVLSSSGANNELVEGFKNELIMLGKTMSVEQQLQPILPALIGVEGRKTYAVLLQNNQELRPTGGFIQAVAFLTFERGTLITSQVMSVYALDNRLNGAVTPPEDLKKYLGETNWFLRDSNWDPHFPDSAARAAWFIENSLGTKVDGVLAINLDTIKELLAATGPLDLPTFNEVITDKNVFERMEFHSEAVLVGSAQNSDYSVVFFDALLKKITSLPSEKIVPLMSVLEKDLNRGNAQLTLLNDSHHKTIASLGWVGGLLSPDCPSRLSSVPCQVNSIAQVEANVGVNKANYYVQRSIVHDVALTRDAARHHRVVTYTNTASSNAWPKGPYKAYTRFYVDQLADLQSVVFNGKTLTPGEFSVSQAHGKKIIALEVNVPIQETRTLELIYLTPLPKEQEFSFAFFNQVQSGFGDTPLQVRFSVADDLSPTVIAPAAQVEGKNISFDKKQDGHGFFGVTLQ